MHLLFIGGREPRASSFEKALNWSCQTVLTFTIA
jgi:hypothetical protein